MSNCYVIGTGTLLKECIRILKQYSFDILNVFTDDEKVIEFCSSINILVLPTHEYAEIQKTGCEYLFSVVNSVIIPQDILDKVSKMAINYHDSLLPKYAGVNASSWSILHGEMQHGITWHRINNGIDTGEVLVQRKIELTAVETTLSLNLRCYEAAIESFSQLLNDIIKNKITTSVQDLGHRSYFRFHDKPAGNGFINWNSSTKEIDQLLRAANFGNTNNTFITAKIIINHTIFIINEYKFQITNSATVPGKISVTSNSFNIETKDGYIEIISMRNLENKIITLNQLNKIFAKSKTATLLNLSELSALQNNGKRIADFEKIWVNEIKNIQVYNALTVNTVGADEKATLLWSLDLKLTRDLTTSIALISFYLYRLNNYEATTIKLLVDNFVAKCAVPIMLPLNLDFEKIIHGLDPMIERISKLEKQPHYEVDLFCRYPELNNLLTNTNIVIDLTTQQKIITTHAGLHLKINQKQDAIEIQCYRVNCNLTKNTGTLASNMREHILNIEYIFHRNENLSTCNFLSNQELQILKRFNHQILPIKTELTILQAILKQADIYPDKVAVVENEINFTYRQLVIMSNVLANQLKDNLEKHYHCKFQRGKIIAVHCKQGINYVISLLACMRLGCSYAPVDPNYPINRKQHIFEDSQSIIIITDSDLVTNERSLELIYHINHEILLENSEAKKLDFSHPDASIYVMYTSGSTGKPKGAVVNHLSFNNLLQWYCDLCLSDKDKVYVITSLSFDMTQKNILGALMTGAEIHFRENKDIYDTHEIANYVRNKRITQINCTTSMFVPMIDSIDKALNFISLNSLVLGANLFSGKELQHLKQVHPELRIFNSYGPAECTDVCACYLINDTDIESNKIIPMNPPIPNSEIFILNKAQTVCPLGMVGEIYVTGIPLAEGYLNKPELTAEVFLQNSIYLSHYQGKMYKTGDRAFIDENGNLIYVNRKDRQVKIRGFRIELGDIESSLTAIEQISEACVILNDNTANQLLYAFVVLKNGLILTETEIYREMKQCLPHYMIPHRIITLKNFPLTLHGKVDHAALIKEIPKQSVVVTHCPPTTETQRKLCQLWSELFNIDIHSVDLDFFHQGGDSLLAIKLAAKIEITFNCKIKVIEIYQNTTIANLSVLLDVKSQQNIIKKHNSKLPLQDAINFVSEQQRMIILVYKTQPETITLYNSAYYFSISGKLNIEILKHAIMHVYGNFKILQENYLIDEDLNISKIFIDTALDFSIIHCQENETVKYLKNTTLDLKKDKLFKVVLFIFENDTYGLVIHGHHCLTDAESITIICKHISISYQSLLNNNDLPLLESTVSYNDYIIWQKEYLKSSIYQDKLTQYINYLQGFQTTPLPYDRLAEGHFRIASQCVYFQLTDDNQQQISNFCLQYGISQFSFFWSLVSLLIGSYTNESTIFAGTYIANRYPYEFTDTVGFFASMFLIRADVDDDLSFVEYVQGLHEQLINNIDLHHIPLRELFKKLRLANQNNVTAHVPLGIEYIHKDQLTTLELDNCSIQPKIIDHANGKFNLSFRFFQREQHKISCAIEYNSHVFQVKTIESIINDFNQLLTKFVQHQTINIKDLKSSIAYSLNPSKNISLSLMPENKELVLDLNTDNNNNSLKSSREKLIEIWKSCLGVMSPGLNDDFFKLGGESLLAIDILRRIRTEFKVTIDIQDFFHNPTIQRLSDYLDQLQAEKYIPPERNDVSNDCSIVRTLTLSTYQPIIHFKLRPHRAATLFCIHPLMNDATIYRYFAEYFDPKIQLLCINSYNYYHQHKISDLSLLASLYIHELKKYQPSGPYFLLGWSYGGYLAYEMAQQLSIKGDKVAGLYLLDAFVLPDSIKFNFQQLLNYFERLSAEIFSINPKNSEEKKHFKDLLTNELSMMLSYQFQLYSGKTILFKAQDAFTHTTQLYSHEHEHFEKLQHYLLNAAANGYQTMISQLETITLSTNHHYLLHDEVGQSIAKHVTQDILHHAFYNLNEISQEKAF